MDKHTDPDGHEEPQQGSLADLNDESSGHAFDQTNGLADGLTGDSEEADAGDDVV
jgi:hypothetical protein